VLRVGATGASSFSFVAGPAAPGGGFNLKRGGFPLLFGAREAAVPSFVSFDAVHHVLGRRWRCSPSSPSDECRTLRLLVRVRCTLASVVRGARLVPLGFPGRRCGLYIKVDAVVFFSFTVGAVDTILCFVAKPYLLVYATLYPFPPVPPPGRAG
jgi:hypothetical protein